MNYWETQLAERDATIVKLHKAVADSDAELQATKAREEGLKQKLAEPCPKCAAQMLATVPVLDAAKK